MKNILMISYDLPPKSVWGLAKHVNRLTNLLKEHFNVTLVSRSRNYENELVSITSNKLSDCLIESELLPNESYIDFEYLMSWNYLLAKKVIAEIKNVPLIVHNHNWMTFPAAIRIADHFNTKLVSSVHFLQKQYSLAYDRLPIDSEDIIALENEIFEKSDVVILFGKNHQRLVMDNYTCTASKVEIIPHGIKLYDNYSSKNYKDITREKVKLLFVGRMVKEKGIKILIKIVEKIQTKYPNIELHIAGKGSENNFENYGFINYHGFLDELNLNRLYQDCDIFCFPSYTETFGLVSLEAASYGLPIIVSRGKYIEELFLPNEALFVDINYKNNFIINKHQLYQNIEKLICNESEYYLYSVKARLASLRYCEKNMLDSYFTLFQKI